MQKEIFIVIIIIIAIVSIDVLTNNYTKKNFGRIDEKLEEIKKIGLSLINEEDKEDEQTWRIRKRLAQHK